MTSPKWHHNWYFWSFITNHSTTENIMMSWSRRLLNHNLNNNSINHSLYYRDCGIN